MELSPVDYQIILDRLLKTKFEAVFPTPFASNEDMQLVAVKTEKYDRNNKECHKYTFAVHITDKGRASSFRGRKGRYNLRSAVENLAKTKDPNLLYGDINFVVLNYQSRYSDEDLKAVVDHAVETNPQAIKNYMDSGKYARSRGVRDEKQKIKDRIAFLRKEIQQLKNIVTVDTWTLNKIMNEAGKYAAQETFAELKTRFGEKLQDVELRFAYPYTADTSATTMANCIEFFNTAFGQLDQTQLFTFLARNQDVSFRRWCALVAPKNLLLPVLIDTDPQIRECAKINREDRLQPMLDKLHELEVELKKLTS